MKPYRKRRPQRQAPAQQVTRAACAPPAAVQKIPVHRYSHPIRTQTAVHANSTDELLAGVLETLSHHSDLLEEMLRRTGVDGSDTK